MNEHMNNSLISIKTVDSFTIVIRKNSLTNELLITTNQKFGTSKNKNKE